MNKRRMATEAISDDDLLKLLIADKYQHRNPQMGISPDEYIQALSRREGSYDPSETEPYIKQVYQELLDKGLDPASAQYNAGFEAPGMSLNEYARINDFPEYY
jgi:hypothetical protein